jgi:hypothetical protein
MSDKIVPIPSYKTSCLAADEGSNYFYLIGSAAPGLLDVNYVPDIFAKTVRQQATISDMNAWSPAAEKACFTYPSQTTANRQVIFIGLVFGFLSFVRPQKLKRKHRMHQKTHNG